MHCLAATFFFTYFVYIYLNYLKFYIKGNDQEPLEVSGGTFCFVSILFSWYWFLYLVGCVGLTSQSTIFQSCRDGAIASWVINQYFRGVKCLAQGHNTAEVGLELRTSRSGVRHSTTEPPRSPRFFTDYRVSSGSPTYTTALFSFLFFFLFIDHTKRLFGKKKKQEAQEP